MPAVILTNHPLPAPEGWALADLVPSHLLKAAGQLVRRGWWGKFRVAITGHGVTLLHKVGCEIHA